MAGTVGIGEVGRGLREGVWVCMCACARVRVCACGVCEWECEGVRGGTAMACTG